MVNQRKNTPDDAGGLNDIVTEARQLLNTEPDWPQMVDDGATDIIARLAAEVERLNDRLSDSWYTDIGARLDAAEAERDAAVAEVERLRGLLDQRPDPDGEGRKWDPLPPPIARQPDRCPKCDSDRPALRNAVSVHQFSALCPDPWHQEQR